MKIETRCTICDKPITDRSCHYDVETASLFHDGCQKEYKVLKSKNEVVYCYNPIGEGNPVVFSEGLSTFLDVIRSEMQECPDGDGYEIVRKKMKSYDIMALPEHTGW